MHLNDTIKTMPPKRSAISDLTLSPFKYLELRWNKSPLCYIPQSGLIFYESLPFGHIILWETQSPRRKSNSSAPSLTPLLPRGHKIQVG